MVSGDCPEIPETLVRLALRDHPDKSDSPERREHPARPATAELLGQPDRLDLPVLPGSKVWSELKVLREPLDRPGRLEVSEQPGRPELLGLLE